MFDFPVDKQMFLCYHTIRTNVHERMIWRRKAAGKTERDVRA